MSDTVKKTRNGAIVYDTDLIDQISDDAFDPEAWPNSVPVAGALRSAGRGNTMIVSHGQREFVLRHYVRGGVPGRFVRDVYIWTGERETRAFAEWHLLAKLLRLGLPVPQPAAAQYTRMGIFYRADLLTVRNPGIRSLADRILQTPGDAKFWSGLGRGIRAFHNAGVFHADLNAYNVQVDEDEQLFLLDFDRGEIRQPGVWQQKTLGRLHRSLKKIKSLEKKLHFGSSNWNELLEGYFNESRSA